MRAVAVFVCLFVCLLRFLFCCWCCNVCFASDLAYQQPSNNKNPQKKRRSDVFSAGASLYGVADTELLAAHTHKFESRYLDLLIGGWVFCGVLVGSLWGFGVFPSFCACPFGPRCLLPTFFLNSKNTRTRSQH